MLKSLTLALALVALPAHAAVFHVEARGYAGIATFDDPLALLPFAASAFGPDSTFVLSFEYDTTAEDTVQDLDGGFYIDAISNMSLAMDGLAYLMPDGGSSIVVLNDRYTPDEPDRPPFDGWLADSVVDDPALGRRTSMGLALFDLRRFALESTALEQLPPRSSWPIAIIYLQIADPSDPYVIFAELDVELRDYVVTEISMPAVPIPSAAFLFSGGLSLLWTLRRRRG